MVLFFVRNCRTSKFTVNYQRVYKSREICNIWIVNNKPVVLRSCLFENSCQVVSTEQFLDILYRVKKYFATFIIRSVRLTVQANLIGLIL